MTAPAVEIVVAQLADAGLNLCLAPAGGLAVAPSSHLTADLRALIRSSKELLIGWLTAANDAVSHARNPPVNPQDWKELAACGDCFKSKGRTVGNCTGVAASAVLRFHVSSLKGRK